MVKFFLYFENTGLIISKIKYPNLVKQIRNDLEVNRNAEITISAPVA
jgi:hypothetical protein